MGIDSAVFPVTASEDGAIRFSGEFQSSSLEEAFRRQQMRDERLIVGVFMALALPGCALYSLSDYQLFGYEPPFLIIQAVRILYVLLCWLIWIVWRRCSCVRRADYLLFILCLLTAAQTIYVNSTRPPTYTGHAIISVLMVLMTYCVTPLPLTYQTASAVLFSAGYIAVSLAAGVGEDGLTVRALAGACVGANAFGALTSWQLNRRRRQVFYAARRERELRVQLEKALAEVRTLRGYLSICAWCKRVRDEEEAWQHVEAYVQSRTDVQFSHSICPHCFEKHFGSDRPGVERKPVAAEAVPVD